MTSILLASTAARLRQCARPAFLAVLLAAQFLATPVIAQPTSANGLEKFPDITLPEAVNGSAAVSALGSTLPAVAAHYGHTTSEFARMLREDQTLWIDTKGRAFYIDASKREDAFTENAEIENGEASSATTSNGLPLLSSKPGALRTIYLDFDGHTTPSSSAWTSVEIVSPPYDRNGDYSFLSASEANEIRTIWRQVAEDFAPFNVNVTTEDPGYDGLVRSTESDQVYGSRILFTENNAGLCGGSCGGVAYVGVFDLVGNDKYQPAWVFNKGANGAGEAASHEVGHNLGLNHDGAPGTAYYRGHGSGPTGWAPIMGVGYSQPLVQWSKGEYLDASNTQDDTARIQFYGIPLMADDHGGSAGSASDLAVISDGVTAQVTAQGVIETPEDVDVFRLYAGAGAYSFSAAPNAADPNLDILMTLRDSNGDLINSSNPIGALGASMSGVLAAGEYSVSIDGVGEGDVLGTGYSDYGSLGNYSITGNVPDASGLQPPVATAAADYILGPAPLQVDFSAGASVFADQYDWNFGDGGSNSGENVSYNYFGPGSYTVTLTATNSASGLTDTDTLVVDVDNRLPNAVIAALPTDLRAPATVDFDASGSSDPDSINAPEHVLVSYAWDFGDGTTDSGETPTHTYTEGGMFTVSLTVTDSLGATDSASVQLDIAGPAFTDVFANSQITSSGTAFGSPSDLIAIDGVEQEVRESESGGKPSRRTSELEHRWYFDVPQGQSTTLYLTGSQDASGDGDNMAFFYQVGTDSEQVLPIQLTTQSTNFVTLLPGGMGSAAIIVRDSNRDAGNQSLDSVYLDELRIRVTDGDGGGNPPTIPTAPSNLATVVSSTTVSLSWSDNADNETGFLIYRSDGGATSNVVASLAANSTAFEDAGLNADSPYGYRVAAFNIAGEADSGTVMVTTDPVSGINLSVTTGKAKGEKQVTLNWEGSTNVVIYRDGNEVASLSGQTSYQESLGKGGGSYLYQVCSSAELSVCSQLVSAVF